MLFNITHDLSKFIYYNLKILETPLNAIMHMISEAKE